jgi:hypothetical protein
VSAEFVDDTVGSTAADRRPVFKSMMVSHIAHDFRRKRLRQV